MSSDLSRLHKKVQKSFSANFSKPQEINGIINFVDVNEKRFSIRSSNNNYKMDCCTSEDLTKIKVDDEITMKGWLKFHPNTGKVCFTAEYIYVLSEKKKYSSIINTYNKLKNILKNDEYRDAIKKITHRRPPSMIYNVGLICVTDDEENITSFKISFQEKCVGELFIYRLKNDNIATSLGSVISYLEKYHVVDVICLLTNNITGLRSICDLSSRTNISYLIDRKKNTPYIISITSCNSANIMTEPLSNLLSNITLEGINNCTDYIHNIQTTYRKKVENSIQNGTKILYQILEQYNKKILDNKLQVAELLDPRFEKILTNIMTPDNSLLMVKELITKRFDKEIILLHNKKNNIIKQLLDDKRINYMFQQIMNSEEKKLSSLGIPLESMAALAKQSQNDKTPDDEINLITSSKNHETSDSIKKIENNSFDNIPGDILSNNIQRKNGDF